MNPTDQAENGEPSLSPNRHLVEVPDRFAVARWSRDADVATIARRPALGPPGDSLDDLK